MSAQFNDTTNYKGLVQIYEKECGMERGYISGNTDRLKEFTADVNLAMDDYLSIALPASGTWQFDDSNHTDYPIITTNITANQRDYAFTADENGNLILDIYQVLILPSATETIYEEISPIDELQDNSDILNANTTVGSPRQYGKLANGIFLDPKPDYNATNGLKVVINREASYFTSSDTTKKPGVPGLHHRYFAIKPALDFARRNNHSSYNRLREEVIGFEGDPENGVVGSIEKYFAKRARDERDVLIPEPIIYQ